MYIPLHWHSTYSFLEALGQPKQIIQYAKELWFSAIAITDYNWMYGIPSLFSASQESKNPDNPEDKWVKWIFGLEIWFVMDIHSSLVWKSVGNLCLLAENDIWYHHMMELVAYANQEGLSNWTSKLDLNILREKSEWIIIFTWWELSWIAKMQSVWESEDKIKEVYEMLKNIFWDKCYLEMTAQDEKIHSAIKKCNQLIYSLAKETNTKLIVNNDYRYLKPADKSSREVALSIKDWTKMYDANRRKPEWQYHIMKGEEIKKICLNNWYSELEINEWMSNNYSIAEGIEAGMLLHQKLFPKYETPENILEFYNKYGNDSIEE